MCTPHVCVNVSVLYCASHRNNTYLNQRDSEKRKKLDLTQAMVVVGEHKMRGWYVGVRWRDGVAYGSFWP